MNANTELSDRPESPPVARDPEKAQIDHYGSRVDGITYDQVFDLIKTWAANREGRRICLAGVPTVLFSRDPDPFREAHGSADLVLPDGMPSVWALRRSGFPDQQRLCGPDLVFWLCRDAATHRIPVGFYGSDNATLGDIRQNLERLYPTLDIRYTHSPPFEPMSFEEERCDMDDINQSGARILFVGLSCPKQELWMARQCNRSEVLMIGIGGAFDVAAGHQSMPPIWMQRVGLHWLYRLIMEPRRLWKRYLVQNSLYLLVVLSDWLRRFAGKAAR